MISCFINKSRTQSLSKKTDNVKVCVCYSVRLLSLWYGRDSEELSPSLVQEEVRLTCTQFVRYHKDQCVQDIVHPHRYEDRLALSKRLENLQSRFEWIVIIFK